MRDDTWHGPRATSPARAGELGKRLVAAGMIRIAARVHYPTDWFIGKPGEGGRNVRRHRFQARVDHQDAVVAHLGSDVAARAYEQVHGALHL